MSNEINGFKCALASLETCGEFRPCVKRFGNYQKNQSTRTRYPRECECHFPIFVFNVRVHSCPFTHISELFERLFWCRFHGNCSKVYSVIFHALFADIGAPIQRAQNISDLKILPEYIPVVPGGKNERYAVMSYWAMHTTQFRQYVAFARMFAAALEGVFDLHSDVNRCPLTFADQPRYQGRLCWCFILERVVNMWAKHAGIRMLLVDMVSGEMKEVPPLPRKQRWSLWFGSKHLEETERRFEERLSPETLKFYRSLG